MYAEAYGQDGELIGAEPSNSRATRQGGAQRGGKCKVLHTFRRGNKVEVNMEGAMHYAHVFGVAFSGKETSPRLKYLLLRDECTGIYFVARFGAFSRTLLQPGAAGADVDDDEQVVTLTDENVQVMVDEYNRVQPFSSLTTPTKLKYAAGKCLN